MAVTQPNGEVTAVDPEINQESIETPITEETVLPLVAPSHDDGKTLLTGESNSTENHENGQEIPEVESIQDTKTSEESTSKKVNPTEDESAEDGKLSEESTTDMNTEVTPALNEELSEEANTKEDSTDQAEEDFKEFIIKIKSEFDIDEPEDVRSTPFDPSQLLEIKIKVEPDLDDSQPTELEMLLSAIKVEPGLEEEASAIKIEPGIEEIAFDIKVEPGLEDDQLSSEAMPPPPPRRKPKNKKSLKGKKIKIEDKLFYTDYKGSIEYIMKRNFPSALSKPPLMELHRMTCVAPVNIAVIKYWGKRDEKLILPTNDSISGTLNMNQMRTKTTVGASPNFKEDLFVLNGQYLPTSSDRIMNVLCAMRNLAAQKNPKSKVHLYKVYIVSVNNFPTAAGLASSAAGFACLVYTLAHLYGVQDQDLTPIARLGSGSACRSLHGGFVHWKMGEDPTGTDSVAEQLVDGLHWPEMRVIIVVVADGAKKVASSRGMRCTAQTSELFQHRIDKCVDGRIKEMKQAIKDKNFEVFGKLTMRDSNQFHAVCLDSYPPIRYLNDTSHKIMDAVHLYNEFQRATRVAYTFDAGPNACLYMLQEDVTHFLSLMCLVFPNDKAHSPEYVRGLDEKYMPFPPKNEGLFGVRPDEIHAPNLLRYLIVSSLGNGPKLLPETDKFNASLLSSMGIPLPEVPVIIRKPIRRELLQFVNVVKPPRDDINEDHLRYFKECLKDTNDTISRIVSTSRLPFYLPYKTVRHMFNDPTIQQEKEVAIEDSIQIDIVAKDDDTTGSIETMIAAINVDNKCDENDVEHKIENVELAADVSKRTLTDSSEAPLVSADQPAELCEPVNADGTHKPDELCEPVNADEIHKPAELCEPVNADETHKPAELCEPVNADGTQMN